MKWLKHHTDAHTNLKVRSIIREFGLEGYGLYWICLEIVGSQGENYTVKKDKDWKLLLEELSNFDQKKTDTILNKFAELKLIDKKQLIRGHLHMPKIQEYSDKYTASLGTKSKNVPLEGEEKRREGEEKEKRKEASLSFLEKIPDQVLTELEEKYNALKSDIQGKADDLVNYCRSHGKKYKNYKSFLENALKRDFGLLTESTRKERERRKEVQESVKIIQDKKIDRSGLVNKMRV